MGEQTYLFDSRQVGQHDLMSHEDFCSSSLLYAAISKVGGLHIAVNRMKRRAGQ